MLQSCVPLIIGRPRQSKSETCFSQAKALLYDGGMSSIRLLRTFAAVAAEGSFAAAAARVALTQAAVGQQMRSLEAELRRPLFGRQGKTVVLNDAGRELVPQVRRLLGLYDQMLAPARGAQTLSGTV